MEAVFRLTLHAGAGGDNHLGVGSEGTLIQMRIVGELAWWVRSMKVIKGNNGSSNCSIMGKH